MDKYRLHTPTSIIEKIAERVKERRLELNLTQKALSKRSGIPFSTYRRFERTGEISLRSLSQLAIVLDAVEEFEMLFTKRQYTSIEEVVADGVQKRERGGRDE